MFPRMPMVWHACAQPNQLSNVLNGFLVSKETVVLRQWGRSKQKFGFIKRVDGCWVATVRDLGG